MRFHINYGRACILCIMNIVTVPGNTVCDSGSGSSDPDSGSSTRSVQALLLQTLSNVAEPGLWVFRVDGPSVVSGGISSVHAVQIEFSSSFSPSLSPYPSLQYTFSLPLSLSLNLSLF